MNILIDNLPNTVVIGDTEYDINSDFRTSVTFEILMNDDELSDEEKISGALELYYPIIPHDLVEAINMMSWFYGGEINEANTNRKARGTPSSKSKRIYCYENDADYIYSAFLAQYGIDLQSSNFHWWKFKALFSSLNKGNKIIEIMNYRAMDIGKIQDKEQRKHYKEMQEIYAIPQSKNEIEKINEIEEALLKGEDLTKILNKV